MAYRIRRTRARGRRPRALAVLVALIVSTAAVQTSAGASRASVPGAPTAPAATTGNARATVTWTAPSANGAAIVAYVVTPYVGAKARPAHTFRSKATTEVVTGLTNGIAYTFRIAAENAKGIGHRSLPTNATADRIAQATTHAGGYRPGSAAVPPRFDLVLIEV